MSTKWLDCGYILINFDETVYFGKNILNNYYHSHSCPSPSVGFSLGNPAFTLPVPPPALPKTCPPPPPFFFFLQRHNCVYNWVKFIRFLFQIHSAAYVTWTLQRKRYLLPMILSIFSCVTFIVYLLLPYPLKSLKNNSVWLICVFQKEECMLLFYYNPHVFFLNSIITTNMSAQV